MTPPISALRPLSPFPAIFSFSLSSTRRLDLPSAMDRLPAAAAAAEGKEGSSVEFGWSTEKHAAYLHSLEVSFVKRVFGSTAADHFQYYHLNGYDYHHQPLDRHLPDSGDSTLDPTNLDLDLNHAKQYRELAASARSKPLVVIAGEADPSHSKGKRSKKSKKRQTSLAQKAPQNGQVSLESVTGSSSGREGGAPQDTKFTKSSAVEAISECHL